MSKRDELVELLEWHSYHCVDCLDDMDCGCLDEEQQEWEEGPYEGIMDRFRKHLAAKIEELYA